ncbi:MAG: hypothetical protein AAGD11_03770 [Planctomycetota bacterium]
MDKKLIAAALLAAFPITCAHATYPDVPLEGGLFNYADPLYMGDYFSFGTNLTYTEGFTPNSFEQTTGLNGFTAASSDITPIPGFVSGSEVPLNGQNLNDLFPATAPEGLVDVWAENSISAVGNFQDGFSSFGVHQKKVAGVSQDSGEFVDAFAEAKSNVPFQVWSDGTDPVPANINISLDSIVNVEGGGGLSEGVFVQLINITDPENPTLLYDVSGFYFLSASSIDGSFLMGDTDLSENLTATPSGDSFADPVDIDFSYDMDIFLDPTMTYAVNVQADASTFVQNDGVAEIDSSNTLDVTISLLDPTASLAIPGAIPEPTTACLLLCGCLAACMRMPGR